MAKKKCNARKKGLKPNIDAKKKVFERTVRSGSEQAAMKLLVQYPELANILYTQGYSALQLAAYFRRHAIVHQLLAMRPHLAEVGGTYGMSLLHFAAEYGYDTLVAELLVEKPHLLDVTDEDGRNALHLAAQCGHEKVVSQLLAARPALINSTDWSGKTPLQFAFERYEDEASLDTTACLLAHGATDVNEEMLWLCLRSSETANDDETVKLMLARKPELIQAVDPNSGGHITVLHYVFDSRTQVEEGEMFFREDLIEQCWQMNPEALHQTDDHNHTPFDLAVRSDNKFAIELVQSKVPLDVIVEAYAKCKKQCPQSIIDTLCEPLLLLGGLNEDVVGVVREYIFFGKAQPPNTNKRRRDDGEANEEDINSRELAIF